MATFRIERHDDEGRTLTPVPVEMRGRSLDGVLNEGDWVEVHGDAEPGETLRPAEVRNVTTGGTFRARSGRRQMVIAVIVALVMVAVFLAGAAALLSGAYNDW